MIKVRFHLGAGPNFMMWQVRHFDRTSYYNPNTESILMYGCTLKNVESIARKINQGENKSVCAWVECESIQIETPKQIQSARPIHFNPRRCVHWTNDIGENLDGGRFDKIISVGRQLYAIDKI